MRIFLLLGTLMLLVSCSHAPWVQASRMGGGGLTPYEEALRRGYVELAEQEAKRDDWQDAYYFGNKAIDVVKLRTVGPQNPEERTLQEEDKLYFTMAYHFLLKLKSMESSETSLELATAQVQYDCWLESQEEYLSDHEGGINCYDKFTSLITEIADAAAEHEYMLIRHDIHYSPIRKERVEYDQADHHS